MQPYTFTLSYIPCRTDLAMTNLIRTFWLGSMRIFSCLTISASRSLPARTNLRWNDMLKILKAAAIWIQ